MNTLVKTFLITALTILVQTVHADDVEEKVRVIEDATTNLSIDLNSTTVRCSDRGYGNVQLKVTVPDLVYVTKFNHVNFGESLPCISAGRCTDGNLPSNILLKAPVTVNVPVRVQLVETMYLNREAGNCTRVLEERVSTVIQGKTFNHLRTAPLGIVPLELCLAK